MRLDHPAGALDVVRWGLRVRLHPRDNGCEKNLLFTPQMYEAVELAQLAAEIARVRAERRGFVFVDIGANVGLFSLFAAACAGPGARILAVEPGAGNFARLQFNIAANPGLPIRPIRTALGDEPGELAVDLHRGDRGGTRTRKVDGTDALRVQAQTLAQLVQEQRIDGIDAMKIDVEGAEELILLPFFQNVRESLWPRLILIEDAGDAWATDLISFLGERGYCVTARSKLNVMLHRMPNGSR